MQRSEGSGSEFDLKLSRSRASANAQREGCDVNGRWSVFSQAMRQV